MWYEIRLAGKVQRDWSDWLDEFRCTLTPGNETLLTGSVPDQAALAGLVGAICQMNLTLLSLKRLD